MLALYLYLICWFLWSLHLWIVESLDRWIVGPGMEREGWLWLGSVGRASYQWTYTHIHVIEPSHNPPRGGGGDRRLTTIISTTTMFDQGYNIRLQFRRYVFESTFRFYVGWLTDNSIQFLFFQAVYTEVILTACQRSVLARTQVLARFLHFTPIQPI